MPACLLRQVPVDACVVLVALEVLAVNQTFDALLDDLGVRLEERQLREDLAHQLLMRQRLARLHDAHDGGLDGQGTVLFHAFTVVAFLERRHRNADLAHLVTA